MLKTFSTALALTVAASLPSLANDTMAEIATGGLVFVRSDAVSIASEDLFIVGPAALHDDRLDPRHVGLEALRQQHHTGVVLVVARPVARPAGDQHDLRGVVGVGRGDDSQHNDREQAPSKTSHQSQSPGS